jgi:chemotaxis protein MotB
MSAQRGMWDRVRGSAPTDLWLISYSDMLTLLLAFFVLLLSVAQVGKRDFERLKSAINQQPLSEDQLNRLSEQVAAWVKREHLDGKVVPTRDADGLRVQFANTVLFDSGKAALNPGGGEVIGRFIGMFRTVDVTYKVTVEGYSDDVPINNPEFRSNWALSSARAVEVLDRFIQAGVQKNRLSAQAFADTRPVDATPPETMSPIEKIAFTRSLNRRVIIRVY